MARISKARGGQNTRRLKSSRVTSPAKFRPVPLSLLPSFPPLPLPSSPYSFDCPDKRSSVEHAEGAAGVACRGGQESRPDPGRLAVPLRMGIILPLGFRENRPPARDAYINSIIMLDGIVGRVNSPPNENSRWSQVERNGS